MPLTTIPWQRRFEEQAAVDGDLALCLSSYSLLSQAGLAQPGAKAGRSRPES
jgi:hypothetical protein